MAVTINGTTGITSPGLSVDSPTLVIDDANNRVGIGTGTPSQNLELFSSGNAIFKIGGASANTSGIILNRGGSEVSRIAHSNSDDLSFYTTGSVTERLRITSDGHLKMPEGAFDLRVGDNTNSNAGTQTISVGSINSGSSGGLQLWANPTNGNSYVQFGDGSAAADQYRGWMNYQHATDNLNFGTSNQERLRITSGGNVGIGSTIPTSKLDVNGVLSCGPGIAPFISAKFRDYNDGSAIYASVVQAGGGKFISGESYYFNSGFWRSDTTTSTAIGLDSGNIRFLTRSGLTANTDFNGPIERMRIHSTGNVTIGPITTAADFITVYNSNNGNPTGITIRNTEATSQYSHARLRLESQNGAAYGEIWADVANSGLRLGYNSASTVRIDSSGFIHLQNGAGIGFGSTPDAPGATSELLDDYEEGTWTPIFRTNTDGQSGQTYTVQVGHYIKIGKLVMFTYDMQLSNLGTFSGNYICLGGLPYLPAKTSNSGGTITVGYHSGFQYSAGSGEQITAYIDSSNIYIMTPSGDGNDYLTVGDVSSQMTNNSRLIGSGTMFVY